MLDNEKTVQSEPIVISTLDDNAKTEPIVEVDANVSALNIKGHNGKQF